MSEKRLARGVLNYPEIGATEHGGSPAGYRRVASRTYLGEGADVYFRVAQGILAWELQRRSGLRVRTESGVARSRRTRGERIRRRALPPQRSL
jgi:uncharacterized protein (UPF0548 family)